MMTLKIIMSWVWSLKPNDGVIISSFIFDVLLFPSEILDIMQCQLNINFWIKLVNL